MWSAGCEVSFYLGNDVAAVEVRGGATRWFDGAGWEAAWHQAVADLDGRATARVWLSGALARPFVFMPPAGLGRWAELEACARSAWTRQPVAAERAWTIALEPWDGQGSALGVACDAAVLSTLNAPTRSLRVRSIRPWWSAAAEASRSLAPRVRLLAAQDTDVVTLLQADERHDWVSADGLASATTGLAHQVVARRRVSGELTESDVVMFELERNAMRSPRAPWVSTVPEAVAS